MSEYQFPKGFLWGAATSAHQIEGGLTNDWSEWETSPQRMAELKKKNLNPIDFISHTAANSYVEHNADIACMRALHLNAYRFSIDWSRIEPRPDEFDEQALYFYAGFIKKLRANHIEPFVTLWHWPIPLWLRDMGGWQSPRIAYYFSRFVEMVVKTLTQDVHFWVTLNEPMVYSSMSYLNGTWPPQKKNPFAYYRVTEHLLRAHREVYQCIKTIDPTSAVGIAKNNIYFEAYNHQLLNRGVKQVADWWWNERFLNRIADVQDFIGLNYYFHNMIRYRPGASHSYERYSDIDWGLHPEGVYPLLMDLKSYQVPIYITENGLADRGDQHRSWYIREILRHTHRAITDGVPVRGYFHWSLIDNFEWAYGFHPRFGLYEVNYETFERVARPSAQYYADICKHNRVV